MRPEYDCIVIGSGIAGLGAALTLKDAGHSVCVLEGAGRVGGRMSTDHVDGFYIDRGVTVIGNRYKNMHALLKRCNLQQHLVPIQFSFRIAEPGHNIKARAKRMDDLLLDRSFSLASKIAVARLGLTGLLNMKRLLHGRSDTCKDLDDESVEEYLYRINGKEVMERALFPGLESVFSGNFEHNSRLVLLQVMNNIYLSGSCAMDKGMGMVTETVARELDVKLNTEVNSVTYDAKGVTIKCKTGETYTAKTVILAFPGNKVPPLCTGLPGRALQLLQQTPYGRMTNAHIALNKPIPGNYTVIGASKHYHPNHCVEVERNRCRSLCPEGKDMATLHGWDSKERKLSELTEAEIDKETDRILDICAPGSKTNILFSHKIKWEEGIAHFPVGRATAMSALRNEMKTWDMPVQLCGDYLDSIASEGALTTGIEAANNIINYLNNYR